MDELDSHYQDAGTEIPEEFPLEDVAEEQIVYPSDGKAESLLGEGIKKLISCDTAPQLGEFLGYLTEEWGGPRQVAKAYYQTFRDAPQGSMVRSRMLERIMTIMESLAGRSSEQEFDDETIIAVMMKELRQHGYTTDTPEVQLPGSPRTLPRPSDDSGDSGT